VKQLVVLDAAAFDALDERADETLRRLVRRIGPRDVEVRCAALTLAEVCRGTARTRRIEVALAQDRGGWRIDVVPTDERLAKSVGRILHTAKADSCHLADAHVVALCADADRAVVITSDPDDINHLAVNLPAVRVVTRRA
jgi:predicted nucleic acid-binding protein